VAQTTSSAIFTSPLFDPKTGILNHAAFVMFQQWQQQLAGGFDPSGNLKSNILPTIGIVGRAGTIGSILQNINQYGVVLPAGLSSATDTLQGAVILPLGAVGHTLGSAAMLPSTAFDPNGAAAAAQTNAQAYADAAANAAQSNAEAAASAALAAAFAPGISVTITTAQLTTLGSQGSMTFTNGLLTGQVQAT